MSTLILDTFPQLSAPMQATTAGGDRVWLMDRERETDWPVPKSVTSVKFAHVLCDPPKTHRIVDHLRKEGVSGEICVGLPADSLAPERDGLTLIHPEQIVPIHIVAYDDPAVLKSGLTLTDDPPLFLCRPERLSIDGTTALADMLADMTHFVSLCDASPNALTLQVDGTHLWTKFARAQGWLDALLDSPLLWTAIRFRDGDATALATVLRIALGYRMRHPESPDLRLEIQSGVDENVERVRRTLHGRPIEANSLQTVHKLWAGEPNSALENALRQIDDAARTLVFHHLPRSGRRDSSPVATFARSALGSPESWVPSYHRVRKQGGPRVCIIPTWQCELRCRYCTIVKQSGREMSVATALRSLDLLFSAPDTDLELHFFGGEPFLAWPLLEEICRVGHQRATREGRTLRFQFTTNGYSLTEDHLDALSDYNTHFQLSLDGDADTQRAIRKTLRPGDSYANSPAHMSEWFAERGLSHDVICVVHPSNVGQLTHNMEHLWDLGYRSIQLNYAIGAHWDEGATEMWSEQLQQLERVMQRRWASGEDITLVNLAESRQRVRSNLHITVDFDGAVYGSNGFLYLEKARERFRLGHLDEAASYTRYVADGLTEADLFAVWTWKGDLENNQRVGGILNQFCEKLARE